MSLQLEKIQRFTDLLCSAQFELFVANKQQPSFCDSKDFELFETVEKLYKYNFPRNNRLDKALKEELEPENMDLLKQILSKLLDLTLGKIKEFLARFEEVKSTHNMGNLIGFFTILLDLNKSLDSGLWMDEERAQLTDVHSQLLKKLQEAPDSNLFKKTVVKKELLPYFTFSQDLSEKSKVLEKIERLLAEIKKKNFPFHLMLELVDLIKLEKSLELSNELFERAADALIPCIIAVDIRVRENYLLVFYEIFNCVKDHNKAMLYVYSLDYFKNEVPDLKKFFKNYESTLTDTLNRIQDYETTPKSNIAPTVRRISFLLTIAPKNTIRQILIFCINWKQLALSIHYILGQIPAFFKLRMKRINNPSISELLIIVLFRRFMTCEQAVLDINKSRDADMLQYLMLLFTRTSYKENGNEKVVSSRPLLSATILMKELILNYLVQHEHVKFLLELLNNMFQLNSNKSHVIKWTPSTDTPWNDVGVDPKILIVALVNIYSNSAEDGLVKKLVETVFFSLSNKLNEDKVSLQTEDLVLFKLDWCLKYCLCNRMDTLKASKIGIPKVLYDSLNVQQKPRFSPLEQELECPATADYLRCIFELGMVSINEAVAFLSLGFEHRPKAVVSGVLAQAYVSSLRSNATAEDIQTHIPLVDKFIEFLEAPLQQHFLHKYDECNFKARKKMATVLFLYEAITIFICKNSPPGEKLNPEQLPQQLSALINAFGTELRKFVANELEPLTCKDCSSVIEDFASLNQYDVLVGLNTLLLMNIKLKNLLEKFQTAPIVFLQIGKEITTIMNVLQKKVCGTELFEAPKEAPPLVVAQQNQQQVLPISLKDFITTASNDESNGPPRTPINSNQQPNLETSDLKHNNFLKSGPSKCNVHEPSRSLNNPNPRTSNPISKNRRFSQNENIREYERDILITTINGNSEFKENRRDNGNDNNLNNNSNNNLNPNKSKKSYNKNNKNKKSRDSDGRSSGSQRVENENPVQNVVENGNATRARFENRNSELPTETGGPRVDGNRNLGPHGGAHYSQNLSRQQNTCTEVVGAPILNAESNFTSSRPYSRGRLLTIEDPPQNSHQNKAQPPRQNRHFDDDTETTVQQPHHPNSQARNNDRDEHRPSSNQHQNDHRPQSNFNRSNNGPRNPRSDFRTFRGAKNSYRGSSAHFNTNDNNEFPPLN